MELTRNEIRVMRIFWTAKRPITRGELLELNPDINWDMASLHGVLNSLLAKGAIKETGFYKNGRRIGRIFTAEYTLDEHLTSLIYPVEDIIDYRCLFKLLLKKSDNMG